MRTLHTATLALLATTAITAPVWAINTCTVVAPCTVGSGQTYADINAAMTAMGLDPTVISLGTLQQAAMLQLGTISGTIEQDITAWTSDTSNFGVTLGCVAGQGLPAYANAGHAAIITVAAGCIVINTANDTKAMQISVPNAGQWFQFHFGRQSRW